MDEKEAEARPLMGTIFLVYMYIYMSVCLVCQINCVGGITWTKRTHAQRQFLGGQTTDTRVIGRAKRAPHWGVRVIYICRYVCLSYVKSRGIT